MFAACGQYWHIVSSSRRCLDPLLQGARFASFAPRLLEHELEEIDFAATHRPLERIERSTLSSSEFGVSFSTDDYNKWGVSGRTFIDPQTTTTSAPTDATTTTTTEEAQTTHRTTKAAEEAATAAQAAAAPRQPITSPSSTDVVGAGSTTGAGSAAAGRARLHGRQGDSLRPAFCC